MAYPGIFSGGLFCLSHMHLPLYKTPPCLLPVLLLTMFPLEKPQGQETMYIHGLVLPQRSQTSECQNLFEASIKAGHTLAKATLLFWPPERVNIACIASSPPIPKDPRWDLH